jgi:hypothetical protein
MTLAKLEPTTMNTTKLVAILLLAVGIIAFAYQGISYKTQENVVDLGPIHVTVERSHTLPLPPIVGAVALIGGAVLFAAGARKS